MSLTEEIILIPLSRDGAEALHAAASVGLEGAEDAGAPINVEAGFAASHSLRRALDSDPVAEAALVRDGIRALEALYSHDKELILIDPSDGVGILEGQDYADLYNLLAFLREGDVDLPRKATVEHRGCQATVELEDDPDPAFAETHLRVRLTCDPPPRGSDTEVYSGPILVRGAGVTTDEATKGEG